MKETDVLKLLPVEDRAKMEKKETPAGVTLPVVLIGLGVGLYYWFGKDFIFDYRTIYPFWGFVIFLLIGFFAALIVSWIYSFYWKDYNNLIKEANDEIEALIKKGDGTQDELFRLKKELIERKIGKETLSQEDFLWHTSNYCWGCGKRHTQPTKQYTVHRERTVSSKEGAYRHTKTLGRTCYIDICPECYARLTQAKRLDGKRGNKSVVMSLLLGIVICAGSFFIWGGTGILISLGIILFGGFYILMLLSYLVLYPFQKHGDSSTKWSFNEIPGIRKFQ